jgi:hypothetical protein
MNNLHLPILVALKSFCFSIYFAKITLSKHSFFFPAGFPKPCKYALSSPHFYIPTRLKKTLQGIYRRFNFIYEMYISKIEAEPASA